LALLQPIGEAVGATSKQRHNLALVYGLSGNQAKAQEIYSKDMDVGKINENLHAIEMVPKPRITPKKEPEIQADKEFEKVLEEETVVND
jgi:hypothetical protein